MPPLSMSINKIRQRIMQEFGIDYNDWFSIMEIREGQRKILSNGYVATSGTKYFIHVRGGNYFDIAINGFHVLTVGLLS